MGKKRKRTSRKERQPRLHAEQQDGANAFEIGTSNNDEISAYSARAVNCEACLHRTESPIPYNEPNVREIIGTLRARATMEIVEQSYILLTEVLTDEHPPINSVLAEGLDMILIEAMHSTDEVIQEHATRILPLLVRHMTEEHLNILMLLGLKDGIDNILSYSPCFIIEKVIETCTILVTKSLNMRNKVAGWVCLSLAELMSPRDHREVTFELTRAVTFFSRDTCYYKPVPEFILKCLAAIARNLMRCQDWKIRAGGLSIITDVARSKDFIVIGRSYVRRILRFLRSRTDFEATAGFFAIGYFIKQRSKNTAKFLHMKVIDKIAHFLARHTAPEIVFEVCPIIQSLLSKKYMRYIDPVVDTGLVLLLLKLLDNGTPDHKDEACTTLRSLNEMWRPRHAVRLVDAGHIRIMCNILKSSNTKHVSCIIALMHSAMEACFALKDDFKTKEAKDLLKEFGADDSVQKFVNSVRKDISMKSLAIKLHTLYLSDVEADSKQNHVAIEKESHAQNLGSTETKICASSNR